MFTLAFDKHRMKNSLPLRFSDTQTPKKYIYTDALVHNKDYVSASPVLGKVRGCVVCLWWLFDPVHLPEFGTLVVYIPGSQKWFNC